MKFDLEQLKTNKLFIFIMLLLVVSLVFINNLFNNIKPASAVVTNDEIEINELIINEVMSSNKGIMNDPLGNASDWLELYNGSNKDINLTNFGLSDADDGQVKWLFPDIIIKAKSYLIVYLSGEKQDGLFANFALRQEGDETITLKNPSGKVIDAMKTQSIENNKSMARNSKGEWIITDDITPGYSNNERGRREYINSFKAMEGMSDLVISEFLPANDGNILFGGKKYSYIEVTNVSEETINLSDYYLSNDDKAPFRWRMPNEELKPGASYLVFTNELNKGNNASFRLKHKTGKVILANINNIVEMVEYEELTNGVAYIKSNNIWHRGSNISPGYPNTTEGMVLFSKNIDLRPESLIINEVMSSNNKYLPQNGNQYYDWIELYNNTNHDINLKDYQLTKDYDDPRMFSLPEVTIKAHQYYVIMASGDTSLSNQSYKHANFKISSGTGLFLYKGESLVDCLYIYSIPVGNSYGRGDSGHYYYSTPTPGKANETNGVREISYKPVFNKEGGIYNDISALDITISSSGTIYYTLDGSVPTTSSPRYNGPIKLKKTTVVRAISYENKKKNSEVVTQSYIINEKHSLPVLSVSMPSASLKNFDNHPYSRAVYKAHAELYEKDSSFSLDCGFKLFGNQSRTLPKKSFQLKFNSTFGKSLHYKVFDNKDIVEFNTLVLRSGSQDYKRSMFKDEFITTMLTNYSNVKVQGSKPVVLYLNGKYWGIYFIREKIDDDFVEKNYNVSGGKTNISTIEYVDYSGSTAPFKSITNYVNTHDMTKKESYDYVKSKIDIENYLDVWSTHYFIYNTDLHNFRYYNNNKLDNGKIKSIVYDTDYAFMFDRGAGYFSYIQSPQSFAKTRVKGDLMRGLFKNAQFRKDFAKRIAYNIQHVWTEEHITETFNYFYNSLEPEVRRNASRWGLNYDTWKRESLSLKNKALKRRAVAIRITKSYFKLTEAEINDYFK